MSVSLLSIIVLCKDEEHTIRKCLESVLRVRQEILKSEIIVVDAHSHDRSVAYARQYPVTIIQPEAQAVHTASAGRFLGTVYSKGEYIFFIDGDMELREGFIKRGVQYLDEHTDVAAVAGIGDEFYLKHSRIVGQRLNFYGRDTHTFQNTVSLGGAALYRRKALEDADHFNPYLFSQEELELALRLRKKGWQLVSLPVPMIRHFTERDRGLEKFAAQLVRNRFTGIGQMLRLSLHSGFFWFSIKRFRPFVCALALEVLMVICVVSWILLREPLCLTVITLLVLSVYTYVWILKKTPFKASETLAKWICITVTFVWGFLIGRRRRSDYSQKITLVKED